MTWMEVLQDESLVGLHAALTPTWSETAAFADYVLPMGHGGERHDIQSQETQSGRWVSFRQPVLRAARERMGETFRYTWETNPGEVWEEDEFWIELSWRIDPDGALGIRRYFESPYEAGREADRPRVLPVDLRELGARPARGRARDLWRSRRFEYMSRKGAYLIEPDVPPGCRTKPATARRGGRGRTASVVAGLPDAVAEARGLLADDGRLGLGRPGHARLHQEPHPPSALDPKPRRDGAAADVPAADLDPHPQREREVPERDLPPQPALGPHLRRRAARAAKPAIWSA